MKIEFTYAAVADPDFCDQENSTRELPELRIEQVLDAIAVEIDAWIGHRTCFLGERCTSVPNQNLFRSDLWDSYHVPHGDLVGFVVHSVRSGQERAQSLKG